MHSTSYFWSGIFCCGFWFFSNGYASLFISIKGVGTFPPQKKRAGTECYLVYNEEQNLPVPPPALVPQPLHILSVRHHIVLRNLQSLLEKQSHFSILLYLYSS